MLGKGSMRAFPCMFAAVLAGCGDSTAATTSGAGFVTVTTAGATPPATDLESTTSSNEGDGAGGAGLPGDDSGGTSTSGGATGVTSTAGVPTSTGGASGEPSGTTGATGEPELPPDCDPASRFIYLLDEVGGLHRFEPASLQRTALGVLECPTEEGLAMGMTIDRGGDAWVLYADRNIFKVDTDTLDCVATPHTPYQHMVASYGLAFSADAVDSPNDTLFISGIVGAVDPDTPTQLGRLVGAALTLEIVGPFSNMKGEQGLADVTGTGDGRLHAFFATSPATLSEVDKQTGALIDPVVLPGLQTGPSWAFGFYAGQFWLFTATAPGGMTRASTFDPDTQAIETKVEDLGVTVVGAGVSTCAPVLPQ